MKRYAGGLVLLAFALLAQAADVRTPEQVIAAYVEACNTRNLDAFMALHGDDIKKYRRADESDASGKQGEWILGTSGKEELRRKYAASFAAKAVNVTVANTIALDDVVVSNDRVTGFADGHTSEEVTMYQVRDGLIRTIWYIERVEKKGAGG